MERCGTCRFWNRNGNPLAGRYEPPSARYDDLPDLQRRCLRILHEPKGRDEVIDKAAFLTDGSGYSASLYTQPMFGCTYWEATE